MASLEDHLKANGARLSRLLIDKGTEAMRNVFDFFHPPATLTATLNSNHIFLGRLRCINSSQMDVLFPPSGVPSKSFDFDITLLFILLRNICGLHPPVSTGKWDMLPPSTDTSREANLARIKYYRNKVYGHITTTGVDDANFHSYWNDISTALIGLGVSVGHVKSLEFSPLEENVYLSRIKEWKEREDKLEVLLQESKDWQKETTNTLEAMVQNQKAVSQKVSNWPQALKGVVQDTVHIVKDVSKRLIEEIIHMPGVLQQLAKCDFKSNIERLNKSFHFGTREWLLKKLDCWLADEVSESRVMMLTAGPGVGKSVFAAKVCEIYEEKGQLAAFHFCSFNYSDYSDPFTMLESLASLMCETVNGFREELSKQMCRRHTKQTIRDAFRVLLKEPLNSLPHQLPMLIVIDGVDESDRESKDSLLDLIAEGFPQLPRWMKVFVTSRPELPVKKYLHHFNFIEILPDDERNNEDLTCFLQSFSTLDLPANKSQMIQLVKKCEGSFLYAYHCQLELRRLDRDVNFLSVAPKGIGSAYEKYFSRLEEELKKLSPNIDFDRILEVLVAMKAPIPLSFVAEILQLPGATRAMKEVIGKVNDALSALLLVYNDCLTIFHKTVLDWLVSEGYGKHSFNVPKEALSGHKHLWQACRREFVKLERSRGKGKKNEAENYAMENAIDHLREITVQPNYILGSMSKGVGAVVLLDRDLNSYGYGWLICNDKNGTYIMTSSDVLHRIMLHACNSSKQIQFFIDSFYDKKPVSCSIAKTKNDFVVVSSEKDCVLDYAVFKVISCSKIRFEKSLNISKQSPVPSDIIGVPYSMLGCPSKFYCQHCTVLQFPEDLVDWLKVSRNRSSLQKIARNIPSPGCNPSIDWRKCKDIKEIIIPYWNIDHDENKCFSGLPFFNFQDFEVVGMCSRRVFINVGTTTNHFINFGVRIDKIIEDINSKKPHVAKVLFPTYFD